MWSPLQLNLYRVVADCAPPKDNEGILYINKGQLYDILDPTSEWWLARLVRDNVPNSPRFCEQGWIPKSFVEKYNGVLDEEELTLVTAGKG